MRLLNLYVVLDTKAKTLIGPIVHDYSEVPIVRQITEAVNKPDGLLAKNAEDFVILKVGTVDEETGQIEAGEPTIVTTAMALRAATQ